MNNKKILLIITGPNGADKIKILVQQLKALGVNIRHEGHEKIVSTKKLKIDSTGVHIA